MMNLPCLPLGHTCHPGPYLSPLGHICHPGLDPGSIFWAFATGGGKTWIPDQVRDDKTNGIGVNKTNGIGVNKTNGIGAYKTNGVRDDTIDDNSLGSIIRA
jgi:hypothetical protein